MYIGLDIGGTHFSVGLLDNEFNILNKKYVKIDNQDNAFTVISNVISEVKQIMQDKEIEAIGVGIPGVCNLETKQLVIDQKHIWRNENIIERLESEFNVPIYFDNDANCATIAEHVLGALKDIDNCMLITIGTGIGAGIILNGHIYRGANYTAGEIGHIIIDSNTKKEFEQCASLKALRNMLKQYNTNDLKDVFNSNNNDIIDIVDKWLDLLSNGLANISNILDINTIAIGGGASEYFEYFDNRLSKLINEKIYNKTRYIKVIKAKLENDAGLIGASMLLFGKGN